MSDVRTEEDWGQLKRRIEEVVQLVEMPIELGDRQLVWQRVANPEVLLEQAVSDAASAPEEVDPFWAATWRAAQGLDRFLGTLTERSGSEKVPPGRRDVLAGQRVLELGCGSGQAGCGAALRGAHVTLTDSVELALQVAELNCRAVSENVTFRKLWWGQQVLETARFPIIIGSDLVYDPQLFPALNVCLRDHLADQGRVYLSEPHRHTGDKFANWIVEAGWKMRPHDVDLGDQRVAIRVFECWDPQ